MTRPSAMAGPATVHSRQVGGTQLSGLTPSMTAVPDRRSRQIEYKAIKKELHSAPKPSGDHEIDVVVDKSWSMRASDPMGLQNELILIAFEHLATVRSKGKWYGRISAFDCPSVYDFPASKLDRRGLQAARDVLLRESPGGCSILGPSLRRAEQAAAQIQGVRRALIVLSDFELFDSDPTAAFSDLVNSSADEVLAVSLNNPPPAALVGTRVRTARVMPGDAPSTLANHLIDAASACAIRR